MGIHVLRIILKRKKDLNINMDFNINTLEKLFNTLTRESVKNKYGIDLTFKIIGLDEDILRVETVEDIPLTLRNYDFNGWGNGRYHWPGAIRRMLQNDSEYLSNPHLIEFGYNDYYDCYDIISLESVGTEICVDSGITLGENMHLSEIEVDEWWDSLSDNNKSKLEKYFG